MLRIAITDDHTLFRKSLGLLINNFDGMQVILEAQNGAELLEGLKHTKVDILLLDLQMPVMDGFETSKILQTEYPAIKTLVLTQLNERDTISRVLKSGVQGFFTKNTDPIELKNAINKLNNNGFYFENSFASIIHGIAKEMEINSAVSENKPLFSAREHEILRLTLKEYSGSSIGEMLNISPKTVEKHKANLMEKTGAQNFIGVITYALQHEIISIDDLKR
ncbi:MAG: response regulator transcription factor [Sphingobacteriales bacterium]|nr:MAG: response regulator transcription factor [Sphingobacteriales bacterium]